MRAESFLDGMLDSLCLRALTWHAQVRAHAARKADERHRSLEIYELAEEAYLYGYPLVLMDHSARFSAIAPRSISSVLPNVHTLSTSAFIDLSRGPWLLTLPDTSDRYYFLSMLDAYSNVFASLGTRATGTSAAEYALVGPSWKRALPPGCKAIVSPSDLVWLRGQFQVDGNHDLPAVFVLTAHCTVRPLNERERPATHLRVDPTFNMRAPAGKLVAKLSDHAFFERLSGLLALYPPPARDAEILKGFERLGLRPGHFSPPASAVRAITGAAGRARRRMHVRVGAATHGWSFDPPLGAYDTLYFERATAALWAFGANLPEDAVSLSTSRDALGRPLEGKSDYVLHLDPACEPPAAAFWSLSLYDRYGHVVSNRIDRYALASSDALARNQDGSLDIYIQREPPASASLANWLPAPDAPYQLILRLYSPEPRALNGDWVPPSIHARPLKLRAQEFVRNAPNAPAS